MSLQETPWQETSRRYLRGVTTDQTAMPLEFPYQIPSSGPSGPSIIGVACDNLDSLDLTVGHGVVLFRPTEATMPSVDVATIGKTASSLVLLICILSYLTWLVTDFYLIYPPLSIFIGIAAALFYFMSYKLRKQWDGDSH